MGLEDHVEIRKLSPSNYPELPVDEIYSQSYSELINQGVSQSHAIQRVADKFNVHSSTVYFELFPYKKDLHKKKPSGNWGYESTKPNFSRWKYNQERARRIQVKRYLSHHVSLAYSMSGYNSMELPKLADLVYEMTGVRFRPVSFISMSDNYKKQHGRALLERYKCHAVPRYGLCQSNK